MSTMHAAASPTIDDLFGGQRALMAGVPPAVFCCLDLTFAVTRDQFGWEDTKGKGGLVLVLLRTESTLAEFPVRENQSTHKGQVLTHIHQQDARSRIGQLDATLRVHRSGKVMLGVLAGSLVREEGTKQYFADTAGLSGSRSRHFFPICSCIQGKSWLRKGAV